jgi:hypothetical protein
MKLFSFLFGLLFDISVLFGGIHELADAYQQFIHNSQDVFVL